MSLYGSLTRSICTELSYSPRPLEGRRHFLGHDFFFLYMRNLVDNFDHAWENTTKVPWNPVYTTNGIYIHPPIIHRSYMYMCCRLFLSTGFVERSEIWTYYYGQLVRSKWSRRQARSDYSIATAKCRALFDISFKSSRRRTCELNLDQ
jgi:hypothetical protein